MANSGTAGYFGGGSPVSSSGSTVDKFDFSDDSRTTLDPGLSLARYQLAAMANSGTAGYFGGGYASAQLGVYDTVDKFAFPSDSRTTLDPGLTDGTRLLAGMANSGTAGYFGGGSTVTSGGGYELTVYKFAFSDDSRTTLGTGLSAAKHSLAAMANSGTAGYFGGGRTTSAYLTRSGRDG
jgi:hypothetical protein